MTTKHKIQQISKQISIPTRSLNSLDSSAKNIRLSCTRYLFPVQEKTTPKTTFWLLHGSYQTRHTWDDFIQLFLQKTGYPMPDTEPANEVTTAPEFSFPRMEELVAFDLRGHGTSEYADNYEPKSISHDLHQLKKNIHDDNTKGITPINDIVMGMSLGGLATLDHWVRYGTGLGGIIVDITPDNGKQRNESMIRLQGMQKDSLEEWIDWAHEFNPHRSKDSLRKRLQYSVGPNEEGKWMWRTDPKFGSLLEKGTSDNQYWTWLWDGLKNLKPESDQTQVLVVRGSRSNVTTQDDIDKLVRIMNEGCDREWVRSVTLDAGHSVQGDAPESFCQQVCEHLKHIYAGTQAPSSKL